MNHLAHGFFFLAWCGGIGTVISWICVSCSEDECRGWLIILAIFCTLLFMVSGFMTNALG